MPDSPTPQPLKAGFAEADISPPLGTQIAGDIGRPRPTEEIRAPIFARAAVFEQGDVRLCYLVMDILAITHGWADRIRDEAASRFGFNRDAVMVHVTQTHSAPCIGHFFCRDDNPIIPPEHDWLRGGDRSYDPIAFDGCMDAIERAIASMTQVTLHTARGVDGRVAFNRRFIMRDGTTSTHAHGGRDNVVCFEGPTDPEVALAQFRTAEGRPHGMLMHFTSHPTNGYAKRFVSPDWCGVWVELMRAQLGKAALPMIVNGCCGNIYGNNQMLAEHHTGERVMGTMFAETSEKLLQRLQPMETAPLGFATKTIDLPLRRLEPEVLAAARKLLEDNPTPMWRENEPDAVEWDWMYAIGRLELQHLLDQGDTYPYEIQAFRIGELAILALTGEPFVEAQLNIKLRSPATHTFVAHMSNGYVGYIPTSQGLRGGGYETWTSYWSKFGPESLGMIADASADLLAEVFGRPARQPVMTLPL